jgi:predicted DNA-binding transcriptional regulator AlpA
MVPLVKTEDLIDAQGVAELLGLAQRTSVSVYQKRYQDMPRPVVDLGAGRPLLWLRPEIEKWGRTTGRLRAVAPRTRD